MCIRDRLGCFALQPFLQIHADPAGIPRIDDDMVPVVGRGTQFYEASILFHIIFCAGKLTVKIPLYHACFRIIVHSQAQIDKDLVEGIEVEPENASVTPIREDVYKRQPPIRSVLL